MISIDARVFFILFASITAAEFPRPADAANVDLTSGTTGTLALNQSFNGETRAADVTLLGVSNQHVSSMTVTGVDIRDAAVSVGARIYASGGTLIASAAVNVAIGNDQTITVPIVANLTAGSSYRLAFFVPSSASGNNGDLFDPSPAGAGGFGYVESQGLFQVNGAFQGIGDFFPAAASASRIARISLVTVPPAAYNLVGWYLRTGAGAALTSRAFTGATGWTWDGQTLTKTGPFEATSFISNNPNSPSLLGDQVTNLTITVTSAGVGTTNAASYYCIEGTFFPVAGGAGCANVSFGSNGQGETTATWTAGGNPKCVTQAIGGDDYSFVDGAPGVPGTPSPRGLTAQTAGQAGGGCAQTSGGIFGPSGAFDLWNVILDDGTYLILANAADIGTCYLFGTTTTSGCPGDASLAGASYLVFAVPGAPDSDHDGNFDGLDNCPAVDNANQKDLPDGDGIGDLCDPDDDGDGILDGADICPLNYDPLQVDTDSDGRSDVCDNCKLVANTLAGDVPGTSPPVPKYQLDSDGDGYGNRCDGDINNSQGANGQVNTTDYTLFRSVLNKPYTFSSNAAKSDLNGDGVVNTTDFGIFRSLINKVPGPSGYCGPLPVVPPASNVTCPPLP